MHMTLLLSAEELALREEQERAEAAQDRLLAERLKAKQKTILPNDGFGLALRKRFAKDSNEI